MLRSEACAQVPTTEVSRQKFSNYQNLYRPEHTDLSEVSK